MRNLATKWDNEYYSNLLKVYNKEELAMMLTHSNMREYGYKNVQDKLKKQNKRYERALKKIIKVNNDCAGCSGDCLWCYEGTREDYDIAIKALGRKK